MLPTSYTATVPSWFHPGGTVIKVHPSDDTFVVTLRSKTVHVVIFRRKTEYEPKWQINSHIAFSEDERAKVKVFFSTDHIIRAFALDVNGTKDIIDRQKQFDIGYFVRQGRFLNIPCPGTGQDRDPNLSIEITNDIQGVIKKMLTAP